MVLQVFSLLSSPVFMPILFQIQPVAREITTELFLLWFVPLLCLTLPRITRNSGQLPPPQPRARRAQLNSTQNSVLLLKITLLLFIYFFLPPTLGCSLIHPVSIFISLLRLLSFNGPRLHHHRLHIVFVFLFLFLAYAVVVEKSNV